MQHYRFRILWASVLLLLLVFPFAEYFKLTGLALLLNGFTTLILISSIHAVSDNRRHMLLAAGMIVPAIVLAWADPFFQWQSLHLAVPIFLLIALGFVAYLILMFALRAGRVDAAKVDAAVCVYLLVGVVWQYFYILIDRLIPGSFNNAALAGRDYLYFSFITLSTLGYGDITPTNGPAQALAYTEAILGQLYLTILVARLVGLYIAYADRESSEDS
jgi:hypothetical protein